MRVTTLAFIVLCVCLAFLVQAEAQKNPKAEKTRHPIILVPGDGGSKLLAKLNKTSGPHYWCYQHTSDYYMLWLNLDLIFSKFMDCFIDNMRLHWNWVDRKTYNTPGVDIRVDNFGSTQAVENLSSWHYWFSDYTKYFYEMVNLLVLDGYTRDKNVFAAPYDFRKAPNELDTFFSNLTRLAESTYYSNNNTKVIMVAHSYGCMLTLGWLQSQSQAWKDKFIEYYVSLAGPYGGTALAYQVYAAGYNLDVWELSALRLRKEQRTSPSLAFLMPNPAVWPKDSVFTTIANKTNYGFTNEMQFFKDIKYPDGWEMRKDTHNLVDVTKPPGVPMYCGYGNASSTALRVDYKTNASFPDAPTEIVKGAGDGTVNLISLEWCKTFKGKQKHSVITELFPYADHMSMVTNFSFASRVVQQIDRVNKGEYRRKKSAAKKNHHRVNRVKPTLSKRGDLKRLLKKLNQMRMSPAV